MLIGTYKGIRVYVFKTILDMPPYFYSSAMNALFIRKGVSVYRAIKATIL